MSGTRALRRVTVVGVVWLLVVGVVAVLPGQSVAAQDGEPVDAGRPGWVDDLEDRTGSPGEVPVAPPWEEGEPAPLPESEGVPPDEFEFPEAQDWEVSLRGDGERAAVASGTEGPVEVAAAVDGFGGDRLGVEVLDRSVAERVGASAFVFQLSETAGSGSGEGVLSESAAADGLPAELMVDFSGFEHAYGGSYASRLRVVAFPDCVLEDPLPDGCDVAGQRLPTRVDREARELVVDVEDLAGLAVEGVESDVPGLEELGVSESELAEAQADVADGGDAEESDATLWSSGSGSDDGVSGLVSPAAQVGAGSGGVVFGVMSVGTGEEGSFDATPMSQSASWQVAPGSGEFSWSYPIPVPDVPGGDGPELAMSYSSGTVDGMTNSVNTQAPEAGMGWGNPGEAFIERRYQPCVRKTEHEDLCWDGYNGTISLEGVSGPLLPLDEDYEEWAVRSDAGWKVERLTGASNGMFEGEHWKVTAPDGTQYFFGLGENPDTAAETRSALGVPVLAWESSQPCWDEDPVYHACERMAWRWNLDRVVDPDGNVTTYYYHRSANGYRSLAGYWDNNHRYHHGARIDRIEYGGREGSSAPAAARVVFGKAYRCNSLSYTECPTPSSAPSGEYPDVPTDQICTPGQTFCPSFSPQFFTVWRYTSLRTEVRVGSGWEQVDQYNLLHVFRQNSDGVRKLYMNQLLRVGVVDGALFPYLPVTFLHTELPNRVDVDPAQERVPMGHFRIGAVANEHGGLTLVDYGQNRSCPQAYLPQFWHDNDRDCFPQTIHDKDHTRTGVFNKYLTMEVTERAGFGSPDIVTAYEYGDASDPDPAWAFNYGSISVGDTEWGWSVWRGYGSTTITQGASETKVRVFRGMHEDPLWADCGGAMGLCGERNVQVAPFSGPGQPFDGSSPVNDLRGLAGRTVEEQQIGTVDGVPDEVVQSTLYKYAHEVTHQGDPGLNVAFDAEWAGVEETIESVATAPGVFRERGGTTTYTDHEVDGLPPRPETSVELGWLADPGDERCSITTYAENETDWMLTYPATNVVREGDDCVTGDELSVTETYYDGSTTLGDIGSRGNPTTQRVKLDGSTWAETETVFDTYGRPVEVTDPEGATTITSFVASPAHAIPTESTVTNDLGHSTTTVWKPELQAPLEVTDPNGNLTSYEYDPLGRVTSVRLPTEQPESSGEPSMRFSYLLDPAGNEPPVVRSRQLTSDDTSPTGANWEESWTVYDGLLRTRQAHGLSPEAGKVLVTETSYDARGMVRDQTAPQAVTGTPGDGLLSVSSWDNRTRSIYDDLGRPTSEEWWRDTGPVHTTSYEYTDDTTTVTGPDGSMVRETVDGLGRTVEVAEHDGTGWVTSSYEYDLADNLLEANDPEGNAISYTYNLAGWKLSQDDPNRGTASFGYDLAGRQTSVTDGLSNEVHTSYDPLGRPVERRADSPTGSLLASWDYDEPGELGLLHSETTHTASGDWVSEVTGYDERNRSQGSTLTVPAGIPGLSGSYTVQNGYDRADRVTDMGLPAIADLPAESLTIKHDSLGLPYELDGTERYAFLSHDDRGRPESMALGHHQGGSLWMAKGWAYDADQRVSEVDAWVDGSAPPDGVVSRHDLVYDEVGNLDEKNVFMNGFSWQECYGYDERQRLTDAYTVTSGGDCDTGTPGTGNFGFEHSYTYSPDGRLTERIEGSTTYTYNYPASGADRPHAPTSVDGDSYTWDANGNLTERTVDGDTETFSWDIQQQLESVDGPDGETTFVYDASGQRLLRQTDDGATLYLAGHEVTANSDGSEVTAVRSYSFGGQMIATRTSDGVDYLITDEAGSVEMSIPDEGLPETSRAYDPYGHVRVHGGPEFDTDKGFVGQIEDSTTNLSYLNARYYDTSIGVFISTDPIYDTADIKTLNPYTYAAGNPASFADPAGLSPSYTYQLENQNHLLRAHNKELRQTIKRLGNQIEDLQGIIKKQNREMQRMLTHIRALEATIRQQASIINRLVDKVNQLAAQVAYWRNQAQYWYGRAQYWKGQAMYWQGEAIKWRTTAFYWGTELVEKRKAVTQMRGQLIEYGMIGGFYGPGGGSPEQIQGIIDGQAETIIRGQDRIDELSTDVQELSADLQELRASIRKDEGGAPSRLEWGAWALQNPLVEGTVGLAIDTAFWGKEGNEMARASGGVPRFLACSATAAFIFDSSCRGQGAWR